MEKLLMPDDTLNNRISYYLLMLLLLSLPFDMFYSHLLLIGLALHTIVQIQKSTIKPLLTSTNFALAAVFLVTLLSTIYSTNKPRAFTELGRQVTILLIPLIFCFNPLDIKKYRHNLLLVFSLGCVATIGYLFLQALITIRYYHLPLKVLVSPAFTNHNFSEPLDIHATFFSMQIVLALVYLIYVFIKEKSAKRRIFYLLCCCLLAAGIIQLSSKSIFVAIVIILNVVIPWFMLRGRIRLKYITIVTSLFIAVIAGIFTMRAFRDRYVTELRKDLSKSTGPELTDPRLARWGVAIAIGSESPVIGHGAGTEVGLLKDPFFDHQFYRSYLAGLNAHNQFISFFIKSGITGLLVYLFALMFGIRAAITRRDLMLMAFMVVVIAVSLSENFLDVDKGIFFYSVFFSLLIFSTSAQQTENQAKNIV
ncbi:O-antigen ligase family protein [Mucilaginibacter sp. SMC90]|uniref:O-antigen ligase family protein n=1 Tax=Mucilaginibacter sp. SMC90 TaxID=2929803 RepID=UPI001FB3C74C|nr:O-antigen ligase family protein [Mucilaginibacter sp. SMC90]UOE46668.1 O-antigen ligase family protein [Mucilaginibacter sp. SMC90]